MRIPISWLKEYVDTKLSVKEIAERLIMSGTEIETISKIDVDPKVVVGEIMKIEKHPNADRLQVTQTSVGKTTLQIVCGASNIEVGQKVPVAMLGAMIGDFEIKETELRGVKSSGMLCSESELELSDDSSGIMILDARAEIGKPVSEIIGKDSALMDAEITPNRGDCLSIIGIARELSAVADGKLKLPEIKVKEDKQKSSISVEIKDKDLCNRYIGRVIKNVKIGPSPKWMQDRLSAVGVRPINNVVDITNYVMFEMGQPLHAFDIDKMSRGKIVVRRAKDKENIITLDGVKRELTINDLVIADSKEAHAIAGVMGGEKSEVTEKTKDVLLESANFNPVSIRKTAQRLGLRTEGSSRHEKGLPLKLTEDAMERAASFISELSGGEILSVRLDEGRKTDERKSVRLDFTKIKSKLGAQIPADKVIKYLEKLGFQVTKKDKNSAEFIVPYFRLDVSIEEDLLEEIARIYGYNNIPSTLPEGALPIYEENRQVLLSNKIRNIMSAMGFSESCSYSFTSKEKADIYRKSDLIQVSNPLSQEQEYMRADLAGSLLGAAARNKEFSEIKLYEISSVYYKEKSKIIERAKLSGVLDVKTNLAEVAIGSVKRLLESLNVKNAEITDAGAKAPFLQLGNILSGKQKLGIIGFVANPQLKGRENAFFELDIHLLETLSKQKSFKSIPKFPGSERDLTFILSKEIKVGEVEQIIDTLTSKIRENFEIIDIYTGKSLPNNKKAVSIRFFYQSPERTLTDKEIDDDQVKIIGKIKDSLGGELRGEKPAK